VTLIELMVTVAILAVIATLAAPSFSDFLQRYRLRGAAEDVASLVAGARVEAVMRNRAVGVVFGGSGAAWCVGAVSAPDPATPGALMPDSATCDCASDASSCKSGERVTVVDGGAHAGVGLTSAPSPSAVTFNRLTGVVAPITGTVATLQSPNAKYSLEVRITPLGHALMCVPAGSPAMAGIPQC
jgi:type IV fimbrial biogenesis protein FimT